MHTRRLLLPAAVASIIALASIFALPRAATPPGPGPARMVTSPPAAEYTSPVGQPSRWGGPPSESDREYWEAKGALIWLPWIKRAVDEGIAAGVVQPAERALFENLLLGVVGVEAGGANPFIKRPHNMEGAESSDGLTQLVRQHLWSDENPFDPLTNLRAGLRTLARYYRGYGNRWDLTLVEHLTGDINIHLKTSGGRFIEGSANPAGPSDDRQRRSYQQRVIEINKMARRLLAAGELWDNAYYFVDSASDEVTRGGMALAPPWGIFDSPDLPFDWAPPSTSRAYGLWAGTQADDAYYQKAVAAGIHVRRGNLDNPGVDAPAPFDGDAQVMFEPIEAPTFNPRPPTAQESAVLSGKPHVPAVDLLDYPVERFAQRPAPLPWYETAAIMQ